jgi:hypothetical protein
VSNPLHFCPHVKLTQRFSGPLANRIQAVDPVAERKESMSSARHSIAWTQPDAGPQVSVFTSGRKGTWIRLLGVLALALYVPPSLFSGPPQSASPSGRVPNAAARHDAEERNRAYPATDIDPAWRQASIDTFARIAARANSETEGSRWNLIGPSTAVFPSTLSFTGASYVTSGRITALAIAPRCDEDSCRLWVGAAGGGIWRTENALERNPEWEFVSASLPTNAIGTITLDSSDPSGRTLYVGTGEPNASADSEAGLGVFKSSDGGRHWVPLAQNSPFVARSIGSIIVRGNTLYVSTTRGVRGIASTGGAVSLAPGAAPWGLYKSTDGGATWTHIHNGAADLSGCSNLAAVAGNGTPCSSRGVNHVEVDPRDSNIVYAASFGRGIWRSNDAGATWMQIHSPLSTANVDRPEFAVTALANGKTRMYVGEGAAGSPRSRAFRSDDVAAGTPVFIDLTSSNPADPGFATFNYCTGQCWYDNAVITPGGRPDEVYIIGSFEYAELQTGQVFQQGSGISNARAVLFSNTAGDPDPAHNNRTFTDMTLDATPGAPNGIHPDQHALVINPNNTSQFFSGSDGGLMRSDGGYADISGQCASRGLTGGPLTACQRLLSRVPRTLTSLNRGLSTLQFQSISVNPRNPENLMGGTQDNGTFEDRGDSTTWPQIIYGDGGLSGFDAGNPRHRFNQFTGGASDVNFRNGDPTKWVIASGPVVAAGEAFPDEPANFYFPEIPDPVVPGTIYLGALHVWRTLDWAGDRDYLETHCPEFTAAINDPTCGDFIPMGSPAGANNAGDLTGTLYGTSRAGGANSVVQRTKADRDTVWTATNPGRLFITHNARCGTATDATCVIWTRLDNLPSAANSPSRFLSGIATDPKNPNRAWVSYTGYSAATPATPGHVFEVVYDPKAGDASWTDLNVDGVNGDLPINGVVRDDVTGDLYVGTDFGVLTDKAGKAGAWSVAGTGLPMVEVSGLTIVPSARILYAATHGRSAWALLLP